MVKTIFALASGAGRCGVSIVRLSGPACGSVYKQMTKRGEMPPVSKLHPVKVYSPTTNDLLDNAMAVLFEKPKSFTGEDVLELHLHGAPIIVSQVYEELGRLDGVRLARPGEFSERAFHSGKLGLQDVEGLADLLAADTDLQRRQALWLLNGGAKLRVQEWRMVLIDALAAVEAYIDFSEDEHIEHDVIVGVDRILRQLITDLESALQSSIGERIRSGYTVAIAGRPNAGKSSLFNELVGRKAAIVSPTAGTTRDVLQCDMDIDGVPVRLMDTAGMRVGWECAVEGEGVARARDAARDSDLVIHLVDPAAGVEDGEDVEEEVLKRDNVITVYNKADLHPIMSPKPNDLWISCHTKHGMDDLVRVIRERLLANQHHPNDHMPVITRQRHRQHLSKCLWHCRAALSTADCVTKAERLRQAARECGRVAGEVDVEEVLDSLFKSFCIGK